MLVYFHSVNNNNNNTNSLNGSRIPHVDRRAEGAKQTGAFLQLSVVKAKKK
jgi:hypothetical protein